MRIWLIFELIDQDLANFLQSSPPLKFRQIQDITHQILSGIDFLHSERVIHRDLKPQNILVTSRGEIKIADFGLSRIYSIGMKLTTEVVTLWYRAPEVLLRCQYATAVDMWSCGTIFAELYTRRPLFEATSEIQLLHKIFEVVGLPRECEWPRDSTIPWSSWSNLPQQPIRSLSCLLPGISPLALDFLQKLVAFDYSKRMSAREALLHPFFEQEENANTPEFRLNNQQDKQTTHYLANKQMKSTSTVQSTATSFISR
ncbi:DgyrCDS4879 [Dimorphilus gyrociliatus]|uniref:DgyrCDS4879 n=1 Tax=Dimorphilus gyrociliatus TaxID=2664684 RepID=A0A7I8VKH9_9ANNE|nr:DgyrCDS4879 [Dimorphilus gyrociliatus]